MKLNPGAEITHKKKKYVGEIPDKTFKEIFGNCSEDEKEAKKIFDAKKKKYEFVEPKEPKEPKNVDSKTGN